MITLVCGGRDFRDRALAFDTLDRFDFEMGGICTVIEGGQRTYIKGRIVGGADYFAQAWAEARGVTYETMPADWRRWGKAMAGRARNLDMLRRWQPQAVLAFPGGPGTQDMIERALSTPAEVYTVSADGLVARARLQ